MKMESDVRKPQIVFHFEEKLGMAKIACDLLAKLTAAVSTELFFKRLVALTVLSDTWQAEDKDHVNDIISEEPLTANNVSNEDILDEEDNWEFDDDDVSPQPLVEKDTFVNRHKIDDSSVENSTLYNVIKTQLSENAKFPNLRASFVNVKRLKYPLKKTSVWFSCKECGFNFTSKERLAHHALRHNRKPSAMPCERCGIMCKTRQILRRHLKQKHEVAVETKPLPCVICGKEFRNLENLKRHKANIHNRHARVCTVCGKLFGRSDHFKLHMRTHTGERPYACTVCDKRFMAGPHLLKHSYTHTGHKPFVCKICGRGYVNAESLKKHSCAYSRMPSLFDTAELPE